MSYSSDISSGNRYCEALKLGIDISGGANNTSFRKYQVGLVQALLDESNEPMDYQEATNRRSVVPYKVPFSPRGNPDDVRNVHDCTPGDTKDYLEQIIDPASFYAAQASFSVTEEQLTSYCEEVNRVTNFAGSEAADVLANTGQQMGITNISHFNDVFTKLYQAMNSLRAKIDRDVAYKLYTCLGVNAATGNNTPVNLPVLNLADFSKREEGLQILMSHMSTNNVNSGYFVVGKGLFERFNTSLAYGCCNYGGLNWDAMSSDAPYKFYVDQYVPIAAGDPDFIFALPYASTKFVWYNRNLLNQSNVGKGTSTYGVISDPMYPGVAYDIEIRPVDCVANALNFEWQVFLRLRYDIVTIPSFAYSATDDLFGVNDVFGYIATTA